MAPKGDRTQAHILRVLRDLLHEAGYDRTSVAEVTRRADITRPAFYFHFDSLGAAVASLMEDFLDRSFAVQTGWFEHEGDDQPENLRTGVAHTVRLWRNDPVVMDAMARSAATDAAARRIWEGWIDLFRERARIVIRADGRSLSPQQRDSLSDFLVSMTFDAMARDVRHLVDGGDPDPCLADTIAEVWIRSVYG
ncbi:MAG TPA: TetR/AcrR family transcriptional regulator [Nocardioides sp.]|nr:TetR/AcrR family transcriptional regulator [Nocardioides sp.]